MGRGESSSATILFGKPGPRRRRDNDAELINERRADRGFRVLYFMASFSDDAETAVADAVADLRHFAHHHGHDWEEALSAAETSFASSVDDERPTAMRQDPPEPGTTPNFYTDNEQQCRRLPHRKLMSLKGVKMAEEVYPELSERDAVAEALADLHHLAERYGVDWDEAVQKGQRYFAGDIEEEYDEAEHEAWTEVYPTLD